MPEGREPPAPLPGGGGAWGDWRLGRRWMRPVAALLLALCLAVPLLLRPHAVRGPRPLSSATLSHSEPRPVGERDRYSSLASAPAVVRAAPRITLGAHLENAYNLSVPEQTFMADGWYWISWPEEVQRLIEANKIDTDKIVEVVNNIIDYDFSVEADSEAPVLRPDGRHYQLFRFSGSFYIAEFELGDYPFHALSLPLLFETRPLSFSLDGPTPVLLVPEPGQKGLVGAYATIKGYREVGVSIDPMIHHYATDFGNGGRQDYALTELRVYYRTPFLTAFLQWVMPLLIVMTVVFMAPSLEGSLGDLRIAIPSTALLTLVVMQQTYQAELPPLPYLTFLDKIYLYCYIVSIALFILFVWGSNAYTAADDHSLERVKRRVARADLGFQVIAIAGLVVVALLAWRF
ncbi:MAG: hypothetical protein ACKOZT_02550 [Cyanobium sp.]